MATMERIGWATTSAGFDWIMAVLSAVLVGGLFLDGWAHTRGRVDQSFFTPWHAVFYAGYAAVAAALLANVLRNQVPGHGWERAVSPGYGLSLLGAAIFALGGVGDLIWHTLFGIEAGVEALLSPTHLALALGMGLVVSGPIRAGWQGPVTASGWAARGPMLVALTSVLSVLTFFTEYSHPLVYAAAGVGHPFGGSVGHGLASILLQTGILMGTILFVVRSGTLPHGAFTVMLTLNAAAMGLLTLSGSYPVALVAAAGAGGLSADLVRVWLRPTARRPAAYRFFGFIVPILFYFWYFMALTLTEGIAWSVHLWAGSIALAGLEGWLLSLLLLPPRSSTTEHPKPAGADES